MQYLPVRDYKLSDLEMATTIVDSSNGNIVSRYRV